MQVKSPKAFNSRIYTLIKDAMDLKGDLTVSPQDDSIEVMLLCHLGCCLGVVVDLMGTVPCGSCATRWSSSMTLRSLYPALSWCMFVCLGAFTYWCIYILF